VSKKNRQRSSTSRAGAGASRAEADAFLDQMLSRLWAAIAAGDPLRAELETASCMAIPRVLGELGPDKADEFTAIVLVNAARRRRAPEGAALLRLIMSLGSPAAKRAASRALAELTADGIYPLDWVTEAGKAIPRQAWRRYDILGDDEAIAVTFGYGEAEHGILVQADLTDVPLVTNIAVAADAAKLIEVVRRDDNPFDRCEQIGLAEARCRLEAPLARCGQDPDFGLDEASANLPLARSRVRRLPAPGQDPSPVFTAADRAAAVDDFMKSPQAAEAAGSDEDATRFWAEVLTGYSSRIPSEPPAQVGPRKLALMILGHVPGTFTLSPAQRHHMEPAVTAWARWSAAYRGLGEPAAARLTEHLPDMFARFDEAYEAPGAVAARADVSDLAASDVDLAWLIDTMTRRSSGGPTE
jgi:hypothetical protein